MKVHKITYVQHLVSKLELIHSFIHSAIAFQVPVMWPYPKRYSYKQIYKICAFIDLQSSESR